MHRREVDINGTPLSFETGKYAKQADGSVVVRMGNSVVLVTACVSANAREGIDFLPLTVDYKENTYASGRIPGGFFKREGKPTEKEEAELATLVEQVNEALPKMRASIDESIATLAELHTDMDAFLREKGIRK